MTLITLKRNMLGPRGSCPGIRPPFVGWGYARGAGKGSKRTLTATTTTLVVGPSLSESTCCCHPGVLKLSARRKVALALLST